MKAHCLVISLIFVTYFSVTAQISGVINLYTPVVGFNCDSTVLSVGGTNGFFEGDLVLIIQMKGASVGLDDNNTFGNIIDTGYVGNYEFNRISIAGNGTVSLLFRLSRPFDVAGKVQLVRVPEYADVTATNLTCKPWDGTTGGILVLDVAGELSLQGNMDVSGNGFRGGQVEDANSLVYHQTGYVFPYNPALSAEKGEGIAIIPTDKSYGSGKSANGGGGGNAHNAGGGGGGNGGAGGDGGLEYYNIPNQPTANTNGLGGQNVPVVQADKPIMGGGGGAGHANDNVGESGGNGGGIVFIRANKLKANNFKILANGNDVVSPGTDRNDGQGGGGAGGSVFLNVQELVDVIQVEAKGGNGGNCLFYVNSQIIGPGGGGGGGKLAYLQGGNNVSVQLSGGLNGVANQGLSNGAKAGKPGVLHGPMRFWKDSAIPTISESFITFCPGDSIAIGGQYYTQPGIVFDTLQNYQGCDSIVTYIITLLPEPAVVFIDFALCRNEAFNFGGVDYYAPAEIIDTLSSVSGCDSIVHYGLLLLPDPSVVYNDIGLCPNEAFNFGGIDYYAPAEIVDTLSSVFGCDSIVYYGLFLLPEPSVVFNDIGLCPNEAFNFGGIDYYAPAEIVDTLSSVYGCDSIVYYSLLLLPEPSVVFIDIALCPNEAFNFGGIDYYAPAEIIDTLSSVYGCDSIVHYGLLLLPQPVRSEIITFCPGDSVVIGAVVYTQPGIVVDTIPGLTGCDTIVTYTLQSELPAPSVVSIHCPAKINLIANPGTVPIAVDYALPTAETDCPCPGLSLNLSAGPAPGGSFSNGTTQVCYEAQDSCGHVATCCFSVTIREVQPCDVKVNGCMRYELLSVTADPGQNLTYRIRVVNSCANKLIYTAIQLPNGVVAMAPNNLTIFTAESGRQYEVRNPNFSPMYSIRFKSTTDSIFGGMSEIFQYTLPAQSAPNYINITSRLATQVFYEAHLNTFYCPIGVTPAGNRDDSAVSLPTSRLRVYPNPTDGALWVDFPNLDQENQTWRIFNSQGQQLLLKAVTETPGLLRIELPIGIPNGLYFFEGVNANGKRETASFVLMR